MKRKIPTKGKFGKFLSADKSPPKTYDEWRESWREKNQQKSAQLRRRGYKRVAAWISPVAAKALAAAQHLHDSSISDEIEKALILNFQVRVQGTTP